MGLHYKFYANPLLCHLLILCTCNPHQQCSLIRCCVIYLCIFYKTYSWGFIEDLGMLTRLYLASFLQCTYINFFSGFMYLGDKLNLLYHALYVQGIFAHLFSYLSHIFYAKHWMHLPIWFQVEFCWSRTFICEPDVAHSFLPLSVLQGVSAWKCLCCLYCPSFDYYFSIHSFLFFLLTIPGFSCGKGRRSK